MLNNITLMGRLTRDPELRYTPAQTPVASFTLAVDRDYQSGGIEKQTDFIDCVAWRSTAEFVSKHCRKGMLIVLAGSLQLRRWVDRQENKRISAEVLVSNCYFAEPKQPAPPGNVSAADFEVSLGFGEGNPFADDEDDELPL